MNKQSSNNINNLISNPLANTVQNSQNRVIDLHQASTQSATSALSNNQPRHRFNGSMPDQSEPDRPVIIQPGGVQNFQKFLEKSNQIVNKQNLHMLSTDMYILHASDNIETSHQNKHNKSFKKNGSKKSKKNQNLELLEICQQELNSGKSKHNSKSKTKIHHKDDHENNYGVSHNTKKSKKNDITHQNQTYYNKQLYQIYRDDHEADRVINQMKKTNHALVSKTQNRLSQEMSSHPAAGSTGGINHIIYGNNTSQGNFNQTASNQHSVTKRKNSQQQANAHHFNENSSAKKAKRQQQVPSHGNQCDVLGGGSSQMQQPPRTADSNQKLASQEQQNMKSVMNDLGLFDFSSNGGPSNKAKNLEPQIGTSKTTHNNPHQYNADLINIVSSEQTTITYPLQNQKKQQQTQKGSIKNKGNSANPRNPASNLNQQRPANQHILKTQNSQDIRSLSQHNNVGGIDTDQQFGNHNKNVNFKDYGSISNTTNNQADKQQPAGNKKQTTGSLSPLSQSITICNGGSQKTNRQHEDLALPLIKQATLTSQVQQQMMQQTQNPTNMGMSSLSNTLSENQLTIQQQTQLQQSKTLEDNNLLFQKIQKDEHGNTRHNHINALTNQNSKTPLLNPSDKQQAVENVRQNNAQSPYGARQDVNGKNLNASNLTKMSTHEMLSFNLNNQSFQQNNNYNDLQYPHNVQVKSVETQDGERTPDQQANTKNQLMKLKQVYHQQQSLLQQSDKGREQQDDNDDKIQPQDVMIAQIQESQQLLNKIIDQQKMTKGDSKQTTPNYMRQKTPSRKDRKSLHGNPTNQMLNSDLSPGIMNFGHNQNSAHVKKSINQQYKQQQNQIQQNRVQITRKSQRIAANSSNMSKKNAVQRFESSNNNDLHNGSITQEQFSVDGCNENLSITKHNTSQCKQSSKEGQISSQNKRQLSLQPVIKREHNQSHATSSNFYQQQDTSKIIDDNSVYAQLNSDGVKLWRIVCQTISVENYIRRAVQKMGWQENSKGMSDNFHIKFDVADKDNQNRIRTNQLYNHFPSNRELTTKAGLCKNLWVNCYYTHEYEIDTLFPRCYDLSDQKQADQFVKEYQQTAILSLLKKYAHEFEQSLDSFAKDLMQQYDDRKKYICHKTYLKQLELKCRNYDAQKYGPQFYNDYLFNTAEPTIPVRESFNYAYNLITKQKIDRNCQKNKHGKIGQRRVSTDFLGYILENSHQMLEENIKDYKWPLYEKIKVIKMHQKMMKFDPQYKSIDGTKNVWVVKPSYNARGLGIYCTNVLKDIIQQGKKNQSKVVQKYIERPLLVNKKKFDFRQWVLVMSWDPLDVYVFSSAYLKICGNDFSLDHLSDVYRHLSNYTLQKQNNSVDQQEEIVMSTEQFEEYMKKQGYNDSKFEWKTDMFPKIKDCIYKSMKAMQETQESKTNCFEIYGFDLVLDEDLNPWIIEINLSPACSERTKWLSQMLNESALDLFNHLQNKIYSIYYHENLNKTQNEFNQIQEQLIRQQMQTQADFNSQINAQMQDNQVQEKLKKIAKKFNQVNYSQLCLNDQEFYEQHDLKDHWVRLDQSLQEYKDYQTANHIMNNMDIGAKNIQQSLEITTVGQTLPNKNTQVDFKYEKKLDLNFKKDKSAKLIQRVFLGYKARKEKRILKQAKSALVIQKTARMFLAKVLRRKLKQQKCTLYVQCQLRRILAKRHADYLRAQRRQHAKIKVSYALASHFKRKKAQKIYRQMLLDHKATKIQKYLKGIIARKQASKMIDYRCKIVMIQLFYKRRFKVKNKSQVQVSKLLKGYLIYNKYKKLRKIRRAYIKMMQTKLDMRVKYCFFKLFMHKTCLRIQSNYRGYKQQVVYKQQLKQIAQQKIQKQFFHKYFLNQLKQTAYQYKYQKNQKASLIQKELKAYLQYKIDKQQQLQALKNLSAIRIQKYLRYRIIKQQFNLMRLQLWAITKMQGLYRIIKAKKKFKRMKKMNKILLHKKQQEEDKKFKKNQNMNSFVEELFEKQMTTKDKSQKSQSQLKNYSKNQAKTQDEDRNKMMSSPTNIKDPNAHLLNKKKPYLQKQVLNQSSTKKPQALGVPAHNAQGQVSGQTRNQSNTVQQQALGNSTVFANNLAQQSNIKNLKEVQGQGRPQLFSGVSQQSQNQNAMRASNGLPMKIMDQDTKMIFSGEKSQIESKTIDNIRESKFNKSSVAAHHHANRRIVSSPKNFTGLKQDQANIPNRNSINSRQNSKPPQQSVTQNGVNQNQNQKCDVQNNNMKMQQHAQKMSGAQGNVKQQNSKFIKQTKSAHHNSDHYRNGQKNQNGTKGVGNHQAKQPSFAESLMNMLQQQNNMNFVHKDNPSAHGNTQQASQMSKKPQTVNPTSELRSTFNNSNASVQHHNNTFQMKNDAQLLREESPYSQHLKVNVPHSQQQVNSAHFQATTAASTSQMHGSSNHQIRKADSKNTLANSHMQQSQKQRDGNNQSQSNLPKLNEFQNQTQNAYLLNRPVKDPRHEVMKQVEKELKMQNQIDQQVRQQSQLEKEQYNNNQNLIIKSPQQVKLPEVANNSENLTSSQISSNTMNRKTMQKGLSSTHVTDTSGQHKHLITEPLIQDPKESPLDRIQENAKLILPQNSMLEKQSFSQPNIQFTESNPNIPTQHQSSNIIPNHSNSQSMNQSQFPTNREIVNQRMTQRENYMKVVQAFSKIEPKHLQINSSKQLSSFRQNPSGPNHGQSQTTTQQQTNAMLSQTKRSESFQNPSGQHSSSHTNPGMVLYSQSSKNATTNAKTSNNRLQSGSISQQPKSKVTTGIGSGSTSSKANLSSKQPRKISQQEGPQNLHGNLLKNNVSSSGVGMLSTSLLNQISQKDIVNASQHKANKVIGNNTKLVII